MDQIDNKILLLFRQTKQIILVLDATRLIRLLPRVTQPQHQPIDHRLVFLALLHKTIGHFHSVTNISNHASMPLVLQLLPLATISQKIINYQQWFIAYVKPHYFYSCAILYACKLFICTTFLNIPTSAYASELSNLMHSHHSYVNVFVYGIHKIYIYQRKS